MRFYSNENFPAPSVVALRALGHNVLTTLEAGRANQRVADEEVLAFAISENRAVLTLNRRDFVRLHAANANHHGIVVCYEDFVFQRLAKRVHAAVHNRIDLVSELITIPRPP